MSQVADRTNWAPGENASGGQIPACALVRVTGAAGGFLQLAQPDADADQRVGVTGRVVIPAGGKGKVTFDPRVVVAYEETDGVPAAGEEWGPAAGSWKLRAGGRGFHVLGGAGQGLVNATRVSNNVRTGWFGRLTSRNPSSPFGWNYVEQTLNGSDAWADHGAEVTGYTAFPSKIDPTLACNPMPGMRAWMWQSRRNGRVEFAVVLSPPLLCEVTVSAAAHTVKQLTYSGGITDYSPATTYANCRSATGSLIAVGAKVLMWKIPDVDGEHWIMSAEGGGGSSAITHDHERGYDNYIVSATTAYANILLKSASAVPLVLPGHGNYQLWWDFTVNVTATDPSFAGNADLGSVRARWYNATNSVAEPDYFAAASRLTTDVLNPSGAPQDTVWQVKAADVDVVEVTQGADANKDFHLQADVTVGGTAGCTVTISEIRVGFLKLS